MDTQVCCPEGVLDIPCNSEKDSTPSVTLVILTLNPPAKLLAEIDKQTVSPKQVIIADDKGIVKAMNNALDRATGDIFVRIDDDVSLPPKWLEELIRPFKRQDVIGVTGPTLVPYKSYPNRDSISFMWNYHHLPLVRWVFDDNHLKPAKICNCGSVSYGSNFFIQPLDTTDIDYLEGTNFAVRTNLLREVGGFDEAYNGVCEWYDVDAIYKIKKKYPEKVLYYANKAVLYHILAKTGAYNDRFQGVGRIKNFIMFHVKHSKFHYKKVIWVLLMVGYFIYRRIYGLINRNTDN